MRLTESSCHLPGVAKALLRRSSWWMMPEAAGLRGAVAKIRCGDPLCSWRKKSASTTRYTCPECGVNAWAKPQVSLICGDCDEPMGADEEAGKTGRGRSATRRPRPEGRPNPREAWKA